MYTRRGEGGAGGICTTKFTKGGPASHLHIFLYLERIAAAQLLKSTMVSLPNASGPHTVGTDGL